MLLSDSSDSPSVLAAQALENAASGETLLQTLDNAGRGSAILSNRQDVADLVINWLRQTLG
jgi:hypothetical protein